MIRNIVFSSGRVQGIVARDTLRFAGVEIPHQRFLLVEKELFTPPEHVWDGILGLAKRQYSVMGEPFFTRLSDQGVAPVFAFVPSRNATPDHIELKIGSGALDSSEIAAETLTWLPSESHGLWYVNASVGVRHHNERRLLVDTGTTVIVMPKADFVAFVKAIRPERGCAFGKGRRRAYCACSDLPNMPPLRFRFGDVTMTLGMLDLFQPLKTSMGGPFGDEPGCELQVSLAAKGKTEWVLGDNFLRKVAVIFDYERNRVGFAAPAVQTSVQMRVVRGVDGQTMVQTRLGQHDAVIARRNMPNMAAGTLVQLSAQLPNPAWGVNLVPKDDKAPRVMKVLTTPAVVALATVLLPMAFLVAITVPRRLLAAQAPAPKPPGTCSGCEDLRLLEPAPPEDAVQPHQ